MFGAEGELIYNAELYWLAVRVEAELAERARALRDHDAVEECERNAVAVLDTFTHAIAKVPGDGAPPEALAFHALAEAELARLRGERTAEPWQVAAERFRSSRDDLPARLCRAARRGGAGAFRRASCRDRRAAKSARTLPRSMLARRRSWRRSRGWRAAAGVSLETEQADGDPAPPATSV